MAGALARAAALCRAAGAAAHAAVRPPRSPQDARDCRSASVRPTYDRHRRRRRGRRGRRSLVRGAAGGGGAFGGPHRAPSEAGHGDEHAQQRRGPCRALLPDGFAEGAAVRRRGGAPLLVLRRARRAARPLRQAGRGEPRRGSAADRGARRPRARQRRRRTRARRPAVHRGARAARRQGLPRCGRRTPAASAAEALVRALLRVVQGNEAMVLAGTQVVGGGPTAHGFEVRTEHERSRRASSSTPRASTPTSCRRRSAASGSRFILAGANTRSCARRGPAGSAASSIRCRCRRATAWACT